MDTKCLLDFDTFKQAIDGLEEFKGRLKLLLFAGLGEPLVNKDIYKMIEYAKKKYIAERIDLLTNAALLTSDVSDRLIEVGLDRLRISLQGLSSQKYYEICGARLSFEDVLSNIRYFSKKRKTTSMYIKIIDIALEKDQEKLFHELFDPICDVADIEYMCPFTKEIDYAQFDKEYHGTMRNNGYFEGSKACPLPFYMIADRKSVV